MVPMTLTNIIVGSGPLPSAVVLRPLPPKQKSAHREVKLASGKDAERLLSGSVPNVLPIGMGMADAANIGQGVDGSRRKRPLTHDLLACVIKALGGSLESVSLTRVEGATFFATLDIKTSEGTHHIDARPSDAIALAIRCHVPILASETMLEQAGMPDFSAIAAEEQAREAEEFHSFVESLSPADFQ